MSLKRTNSYFSSKSIVSHSFSHRLVSVKVRGRVNILQATELESLRLLCIPFKGQEVKWTPFWQDVYKRLLSKATAIKVVFPGTCGFSKYHKRNEYMVDNSDEVLALWNGDLNGGTYSCLQYAEKLFRPINNVWEKWLNYA